MECRPVEIKLISASGIKDVNTLSKMDVYVTVSVSGDPRSVQRSPIDKDGGINPRWNNHDVNFVVDELAAQNSRIGFVFQIMSNRTLGDKEAGRVYIPVKELLDRYDNDVGSGVHSEVEYQVRTPSGKLKGTFKFSYAIGDNFTQKVAPIVESPPPMAHPAAIVFSTTEPYPSPSGYTVAPYAQPVGYGYGYPSPAVTTKPMGDVGGPRTGFVGIGTATGVGMGLLGGLLIGEMVDDVADVAFD